MDVGIIVHGLSDKERQVSYRADITYGTNNEFGFDYLRDNMKESIERYVQRELRYAIVDEVDSILIDEARTPLIINGPARSGDRKCSSFHPRQPSAATKRARPARPSVSSAASPSARPPLHSLLRHSSTGSRRWRSS
jgi:hypothetical protein